MEYTRNSVSSSIGAPASTSRMPYVDRWAICPRRATRTSHPGRRPSSTYRRKWVSMRASRVASKPTSPGSTSTLMSPIADLHDHLDLDGDVERELSLPDGGARVLA